MADHVPVLALDLATRTGWALRARDGSVTSGVQVFDLRRGESPGMRFLRFRRWLNEVLDTSYGFTGRTLAGELGAGVIAYEAAHHRGGHATAVGVGLTTIALEVAAGRALEVTSVHTATLKKHATGSGRAGKDDMVRAAAKRWPAQVGLRAAHLDGGSPADPLGEDEADALCVLAWALDEIEVPRA